DSIGGGADHVGQVEGSERRADAEALVGFFALLLGQAPEALGESLADAEEGGLRQALVGGTQTVAQDADDVKSGARVAEEPAEIFLVKRHQGRLFMRKR